MLAINDTEHWSVFTVHCRKCRGEGDWLSRCEGGRAGRLFCCIRREARYCRIGYTASSDPDSFKVSRNPTSYLANTGEGGCGPDTLKIPEGSNNGDKTSCTNPTGTVPTVDFYCGGSLNCVTGKANPSVIITSVSPLRVTKLSLISYFLGTDYHSRWRLTSTLPRQVLETEGSV